MCERPEASLSELNLHLRLRRAQVFKEKDIRTIGAQRRMREMRAGRKNFKFKREKEQSTTNCGTRKHFQVNCLRFGFCDGPGIHYRINYQRCIASSLANNKKHVSVVGVCRAECAPTSLVRTAWRSPSIPWAFLSS